MHAYTKHKTHARPQFAGVLFHTPIRAAFYGDTMNATKPLTVTRRPTQFIIPGMNSRLKRPRSAAEKARDTGAIIGNLRHEGYAPTAEEEAVHQRVTRGELSTEQAITIFRERGLAAEALARPQRKRTQRA